MTIAGSLASARRDPSFFFVMRLFAALTVLAFVGCAAPVPHPQLSAADSIMIDSQSEWAEFADYLRGTIRTVETRWYAILNESRVGPRVGTHVTVKFTFDAEGKATVVHADGDAGHQGTYACTSALTGDPIGKKWTDAMIAKLGREQTMTFTFFYY